jgi:hypothetical protein
MQRVIGREIRDSQSQLKEREEDDAHNEAECYVARETTRLVARGLRRSGRIRARSRCLLR